MGLQQWGQVGTSHTTEKWQPVFELDEEADPCSGVTLPVKQKTFLLEMKNGYLLFYDIIIINTLILSR